MSSVHCKIKTLIISRRPGSLPPRSNERAILFREEGAGEGGWVGGETHFRSLRRVHETGLSKIRPQASSCLSTFLPWKRVPGIAYPSHLSLNLLLGPQTYQDLLHLLCVTHGNRSWRVQVLYIFTIAWPHCGHKLNRVGDILRVG